MPSPPWKLSAGELPEAGLAPFQGEHNREVLAELGLSDPEIDKLHEAGVMIDTVPPDLEGPWSSERVGGGT